MVFWSPTHGILIPYPWYIDPPTHGILNPLPMVFWPPYPWYFDPLSMVYWTLYSWYSNPHIHGILTPYPWYFDPLSMVYWPPYPWYIDRLHIVYQTLSFGRNEEGQFTMRGFKIQWRKIDPGVKTPYDTVILYRGKFLWGKNFAVFV